MTDATLSAEELAASPAAPSLSDADSDADSEVESEAEQDPEAADGSDLQMAGGTLSDEELAAVTALLGTLAGASGTDGNGAGTAGPSDRTLQRRRRLGLWGRPGPGSWKHAAGLR